MPGKVTVHGLCIESDMLLKDSCVVSNEHTLGFDIAKFINDFQVRNFYHFIAFNIQYICI